mmetsp:Transcript_67258/g.176385  ORF Transcript_67258/g.176385 Transcript_67258/m.176385 type:complete len:293 (+) Transcript_67258:79-957(+)
MPQSSRAASASSFARGGRDSIAAGPVQLHPSEHAEQQFSGLFRGLGATSKEPTCNKRSSSLKRLHDATHFAVGCKKWEEGGHACSTAQAAYLDPQVVYATVDAPDKNESKVELHQGHHDPVAHYRTEQRERFDDPGPQPRDMPFDLGRSRVHLGDDRPELTTQMKSVHTRPSDDEAERSAALRMAGAGTLIQNSMWPKPERCHPIHGGYRQTEVHDLGLAQGMHFPRISQNNSTIIHEANIRNPILGHHVPLKAFHAYHSHPGAPLPSHEVVNQANACAPYLRSLGALRPHH